MNSKKSQITVFLIVAIILLLGIAIAIILTRPSEVVEITQEVDFQKEIDSINRFITSCIEQVSYPLLTEISEKGGSFKDRPSKLYNQKNYPYICLFNPYSGCVNIPLSRQTMEQELNEKIRFAFEQCSDLSIFEKKGIRFKRGTVNVTTIIGAKYAFVKVHHPLEITVSDFERTLSDFNSKINLELGTMYDIMRHITNSEIEITFDEDTWMLDNGVFVEVYKHKPYPDIVYSLRKFNKVTNEYLTFNFALQGQDTTSKIFPLQNTESKGYCVEEGGSCIVNMAPSSCRDVGGYWHNRKPAECEQVQRYNEPICENCSGCGPYKHGESWCVYDNVAGLGFDLVGTRHYKQTCLNGVIYDTECRDYREEICTQNIIDGLSKAVCRDNRWEDCAQQTSPESCLDLGLRDCQWKDYLNKSFPWKCLKTNYSMQKCHPYVPPGFEHWKGEGKDICSFANEQFNCDEMSCPQNWVDSTSIYCYSQGDCGAYYNIVGNYSSKGYYNDDLQSNNGSPRNYTFVIPFQKGLTVLNLPFTTNRSYFDQSIFDYPKGSEDTLNDNSRVYQQNCSKPKVTSDHIHSVILGTARCGVFSLQENVNMCERCDNDPRKPCSEYNCRSMGANCFYQEFNGTGTCVTLIPDYKSPEVNLDEYAIVAPPVENINSMPSETSSLKPYRDFGMSGLIIEEPIRPYSYLLLEINSTEDISCKYSSSPQVDFENLPPSPYKRSHFIKIPVIPSYKIYKSLLSSSTNHPLGAFMLSTYTKELDIIEKDFLTSSRSHNVNQSLIEKTFDQAEEQIKTQLSSVLDPLKKTYQVIFLDNIQGKSNLFFTCRDRLGDETAFFLKYSIEKDNYPPKILKVTPETESYLLSPANINITVDEPSLCRFSDVDQPFENMEHPFNCKDSDAVTDCYGQAVLNPGSNQFFIRCQDNPPVERTYYLNINKSYRFAVSNDTLPGIIAEDKSIIINSPVGAFHLRDSCTLHPADPSGFAQYTQSDLSKCYNKGDIFECPFGNITSPWLNPCDFINVRNDQAPPFKKKIIASTIPLEYSNHMVEVDEDQIEFYFKVGSDMSCKYTSGSETFDALPKNMQCSLTPDSRYTCKTSFNVADIRYRIICRENTEIQSNTNTASTTVTYYGR